MRILTTKAEIRDVRAGWLADGVSVGLVPTMGYLHDGHLALVRQAHADNERVIASLFVNPAQFGPNEDLSTYPRDTDRDMALFKSNGVDAVFAPSVDEMYSARSETIVEATRLSKILIGRIRPGHFRGVTTVVAKLFNLMQPTRAYFGEKDYQQLVVIRRMVADLDMPVDVVGVPIVREQDGLAMSSRNVRLSGENRSAAVVLNQALGVGDDAIAKGPVTASRLKRTMQQVLAQVPQATQPSVDIRDAANLGQVRGVIHQPVVALLSARFGSVLLIDQRVMTPAE